LFFLLGPRTNKLRHFFFELFKIDVILGKKAHDITGTALENPACTLQSPPPPLPPPKGGRRRAVERWRVVVGGERGRASFLVLSKVQNFYWLMKFILCFVVRFGEKRSKKGGER
jgi:hypothetical protein